MQCPECHEMFTSNNEFMTHLKRHANPDDTENSVQCRYCLTNLADDKELELHLTTDHPITSSNPPKYNCVICWVSEIH